MWDTIVVGAGPAGLAAARELGWRNRSVLLLEARDRLGGRTFSDSRGGRRVELGGAFVHWWQGQSITEVQRYGLEVEFVPFLSEACYWPGALGAQTRGTDSELRSILVGLMGRVFEDAGTIIPKPFEPLVGTKQDELDHLSVADKLVQLNLSPGERDLLAGVFCSMASGVSDDVGFLSLVRLLALHGWDLGQLMDRTHYRLTGGTSSLMNAMLEDAGCECRLSTPVARVTTEDGGVVVTTREGEVLSAKAVVLAVPLSALSNIELPDNAPPAWHDVAKVGSASRGIKVVIRADPGTGSLFAVGSEDKPITWLITEAEREDSTDLVGFGPDASRLDGNDVAAVQAAIDEIAPDVRVIEAHSHDWLLDEFAQGTWGFLRPNQLTGALAALNEPHDGIHLAGGDIASGWMSFISGAIESGIGVGRSVDGRLG